MTYFDLREKTDIEKRLDTAKDGQSVQKDAIDDLGTIASALAEAQEGAE